jgi:hypothetical protein
VPALYRGWNDTRAVRSVASRLRLPNIRTECGEYWTVQLFKVKNPLTLQAQFYVGRKPRHFRLSSSASNYYQMSKSVVSSM